MGRREIVKLTKQESALIIRDAGDVEIVGAKYGNVLSMFAAGLLRENKPLWEALKENQKLFLEEQLAALAEKHPEMVKEAKEAEEKQKTMEEKDEVVEKND